MRNKNLKAFGIVFVCFLFLSGAVGHAQSYYGQNQVKINSVTRTNMFFGGNILVTGESAPNITIALTIEQENSSFSYFIKTNADVQGNWVANFDQLLKSGKYYVTATAQDYQGNILGQAKSGPVEIKGSLAFMVFGFSFLIIILLTGFVGGWYISRVAEIKRYRRILISQRDILASYNVLRNDIDKVIKNLDGEKNEQWKVDDAKFFIKRTSENLEKMNKYVVKGVNIIGKYDIISKAYGKFK
jgi:hypothetical protein